MIELLRYLESRPDDRGNRQASCLIDREQSGWLAGFRARPDDRIHVGVRLKSGVWLQGILYSYAKTGDEVPEGALVLSGRIHYRAADGENMYPLKGLFKRRGAGRRNRSPNGGIRTGGRRRPR